MPISPSVDRNFGDDSESMRRPDSSIVPLQGLQDHLSLDIVTGFFELRRGRPRGIRQFEVDD